MRYPHPDVLQVLDPRPLLDSAAGIAARYGTAGLLTAETLAAGLAHGKVLFFGTDRNVGRRLAQIADELPSRSGSSEPLPLPQSPVTLLVRAAGLGDWWP